MDLDGKDFGVMTLFFVIFCVGVCMFGDIVETWKEW